MYGVDASQRLKDVKLSLFFPLAPGETEIALFGVTTVYSDLGLYSKAEAAARERLEMLERLSSSDEMALANAGGRWRFAAYLSRIEK